jgi:hypothetical protein
MRRQLPPSKLLVPPGPQAFPQRHFLGESTVIVNHYSGFEKAIPAIPSLPGFRTSAGMFSILLWVGGRVTGTLNAILREPTPQLNLDFNFKRELFADELSQHSLQV